MSNIENEIKILLNLFNSAKFDILISKAKKLVKKNPEYLILYNILGSAYQNKGDLKLCYFTICSLGRFGWFIHIRHIQVD